MSEFFKTDFWDLISFEQRSNTNKSLRKLVRNLGRQAVLDKEI